MAAIKFSNSWDSSKLGNIIAVNLIKLYINQPEACPSFGYTGRRSSFALLTPQYLYWSTCFCEYMHVHLHTLFHYCNLSLHVISTVNFSWIPWCPMIVTVHCQSNSSMGVIIIIPCWGTWYFSPPWLLHVAQSRVVCHFFCCFCSHWWCESYKTSKYCNR